MPSRRLGTQMLYMSASTSIGPMQAVQLTRNKPCKNAKIQADRA